MTKSVKQILHHIVVWLFVASCLFLLYSFYGHLIIKENDVIERNDPVEFNDPVQYDGPIGFDDPNDYSIPPITDEELKNQAERRNSRRYPQNK